MEEYFLLSSVLPLRRRSVTSSDVRVTVLELVLPCPDQNKGIASRKSGLSVDGINRFFPEAFERILHLLDKRPTKSPLFPRAGGRGCKCLLDKKVYFIAFIRCLAFETVNL